MSYDLAKNAHSTMISCAVQSCAAGRTCALLASFILLASIFVVSTAAAGAGCSACGVAEWDPSAFLNSDEVPGALPANTGSVVAGDAAGDAAASPDANESGAETTDDGQEEYRSGQFPNGEMLKALSSVSSSDLVLDVSGGDRYSHSHIKGAVHIPAQGFLAEDGRVKSVEELAAILGEAGVSRDDSVVVYSDSLDSGEATFAVWVLSYIGQEDVKLLDGSLEDWSSNGLPLESGAITVAAAKYIPAPRQDLLASYEDVEDGLSQIVDARSLQEFSLGRIPGAALMDPEDIVDAGRIRNSAVLSGEFTRLDKDKSVIVYSEDGLKASLIWFALQLMGHDSRLYTWSDWESHQLSSEPAETSLIGSSGSKSPETKGYKKLGTT